MYGPVREKRLWRIRNNRQVKGIICTLDVGSDIKRKILEWLGHNIRMDPANVIMTVFERKL
jgi:hypothetical protein